MSRALVLAGGGVAGVAWETGVLFGIEEVDSKLAEALVSSDLVLGTSAGSAVAAQITTGRSLGDLYQAQVDEATPELSVELNMEELVARLGEAVAGATSGDDARRRIGRMALETKTVEETARRSVIELRLGGAGWPAANIGIVVVDAETGAAIVFDRGSGVDLVDAVTASCAVPGVWPPATISGRRYIDGGVRSTSNVDLAAGHDVIVVLSPVGPDYAGLGGKSLNEELSTLGGSSSVVVAADEASTSAFGTNPLSPDTRRPSAEAGRAQGRAEASRIAEYV